MEKDQPDISQEKLNRWDQTHWKQPRGCPICAAVEWSVDSNVAAIPHMAGRTIRIGGPILPLMAITCGRCGYTFFVNAKVANLLPLVSSEEGSAPISTSGQPESEAGVEKGKGAKK